jgi:sulfate permease, SulP family
VRLDGPLYFGSVEHVEAEWKRLRAKRPGQKHMIFYLKGVGKIDLAGADFLIQAIREVHAEGGSFHIVALLPPLLDCLRRLNVVEEIGEDHLHISKGDALAAVIGQLDMSVCAQCTRRVFTECARLPGGSAHADVSLVRA